MTSKKEKKIQNNKYFNNRINFSFTYKLSFSFQIYLQEKSLSVEYINTSNTNKNPLAASKPKP